jgi:hypothetical protein
MLKLEKLETVLGKELTEKLRSVFSTAPKNEPIVFVKLADGSAELNGTIEVGSAITIVTPEGEVPAPNGEHAIEGGKTITVADGVITEIADTMVEAVEEEEVMSAEKIEALIQSSLTTQANEFKKVTDALNATITELIESNKASFQAVVESLELMTEIKVPAPEPKADPKNVYAQKKAQAFSKFLEIKEQIKTK